MKIFVAFLFAISLLSGCGLKGPLSSPDDHTSKVVSHSTLNRVI